ncbi:MAG: hypothetical protein JWL76_2286 [Thermoleophilia bacterium]|nr:hypothetical protein [Thermoleophilia bacterium]
MSVPPLVVFECGDPDEHDPAHRELRIDDLAEIKGMLTALRSCFDGEIPSCWGLEAQVVRELCQRKGWLAMPLSGDRFGEESDRELALYFDHIERTGIELRLVNTESPDAAWVPGHPLRRLLNRPGAYTFKRGKSVPATDIYRLANAQDYAALEARSWYGILTTTELDFMVIESDEFHVLVGSAELLGNLYSDAELREAWSRVVEDATFWPDDGAGRSEMREWVNALLAAYRPSNHS